MSLEFYITAVLVVEVILLVAAVWLLSRADQMYLVYGDTDSLGDNDPRVQRRLRVVVGISTIMFILSDITMTGTPETVKYWLGWLGVIALAINFIVVALMVFDWLELDDFFKR